MRRLCWNPRLMPWVNTSSLVNREINLTSSPQSHTSSGKGSGGWGGGKAAVNHGYLRARGPDRLLMPPSPFCQLIRWFIAIYKREKTLKATQIWCNTRAHTHNVTRHKCMFSSSQWLTEHTNVRGDILYPFSSTCVHLMPCHGLGFVFRLCVCACIFLFNFFLLLLFRDYAYVFPASITVLVSTRASSYLPRAFTQGISISLHVCCRDGKTHPQPDEETRKGINEGERGHRCQRRRRRRRRRRRVWILSCREHMGVALCRRGRDKESRRWEAMQAVVKSGEGVAGLSWSMAK